MVIPGWLTVVSWIFIGVGLLSAALILADIYLLGYREHVKIMEAVGERAGLATTYRNIAYIQFAGGKVKEATVGVSEAIAIARELGATADSAGHLWSLAYFVLEDGNRKQAAQNAQESLDLFEKLGLEKDAARVREWIRENDLTP